MPSSCTQLIRPCALCNERAHGRVVFVVEERAASRKPTYRRERLPVCGEHHDPFRSDEFGYISECVVARDENGKKLVLVGVARDSGNVYDRRQALR